MANLVKVISATVAAEVTRLAYFVTKPFMKKRVWLLCETASQAQENGYELFRWIRENKPEIDAYYVIKRDSPSIDKFLSEQEWLALGSLKQLFYMYHAEAIISTHGLWMIPDELGILKKLTSKTLKAKRVMLNHGVGFLKNGKQFYHKTVFPLNNQIMALSPKHKAIFVEEYGYDDSEVKVAGYPRFDGMTDLSAQSKWPNLIVYMPTFRDNEQHLGDGFTQTELFKHTEALLKSDSFKQHLEQNDAHIAVYLHQNIQACSQYFDSLSSSRIHIVRQGQHSVTELLRMGKLLITDYSSVFFDFVYMNKPFISYQFDYEEFIGARKNKAFIDIRHDLPGYVANTPSELEQQIAQVFADGFALLPAHQDKVKQYFSFQDQNNCERVFNAINQR
ncbi:CDP-glycerol glycerophosphotransferase family protein [Agarivorans sp. TSD2052]|uniref:CDP-glycerol glycerophosphotransferase family protein n=1 Tax=Agarivorans sp. TSD2052 TaxID=2937286 RepID=UPI00200ED4F9|nr:CDP-glycerol glycerophosphotransferase family protein [Agarivorans sp. TSD2052]UPW18547.1 CDP-glycerol glycerophosphotransferase family protein [Agarivorans sp. TSD2052]